MVFFHTGVVGDKIIEFIRNDGIVPGAKNPPFKCIAVHKVDSDKYNEAIENGYGVSFDYIEPYTIEKAPTNTARTVWAHIIKKPDELERRLKGVFPQFTLARDLEGRFPEIFQDYLARAIEYVREKVDVVIPHFYFDRDNALWY